MFRRSRHISIEVTTDQLDDAVQHYKKLFGIEQENRTSDGVELTGCNFTLWLDVAQDKPQILHEWVTTDGVGARVAVQNSGATITGESHCGFYVSDPYGMAYHVYVEDEAET